MPTRSIEPPAERKRQFSLRELLLATTCIAVLLALAQWLWLSTVFQIGVLMLLVGVTRGRALGPAVVGLAIFTMFSVAWVYHSTRWLANPGLWEKLEMLGLWVTVKESNALAMLLTLFYLVLLLVA